MCGHMLLARHAVLRIASTETSLRNVMIARLKRILLMMLEEKIVLGFSANVLKSWG